jgi:hypothetical protein
MKAKMFILFILVVLCIGLVVACKSEKTPVQPQTVAIPLEQSTLDTLKTAKHVGISGKFRDDSTGRQEDFPHDGSIGTGDSTIRDVFAAIRRDSTGEISVGSMIAKRVYRKNASGNRDTLAAVFVMYKQPKGYFSEGKDWEFMVLPGSSVNNLNPNGQVRLAQERGKMTFCSNCHKAGRKDFLFLQYQ